MMPNREWTGLFWRTRHRTVRSILVLFEWLLLFAVISMVLLYYFSSAKIIRQQFFSNLKVSVQQQAEMIDTYLKQSNEQLISLSSKVETLDSLQRNEQNTTEFNIAAYRMQDALQKSFQYDRHIDEAFFFYPEEAVYIQYNRKSLPYDYQISAREQIIGFILDNQPTYGGWFSLPALEGQILVKLLPVEEGYLGVWSSANTLLSFLGTESQASSELRTLVSRDNRMMNISTSENELEIINNADSTMVTNLEGKRYIISQRTLKYGDFSLAIMWEESSLLTRLRVINPVIFITILIIIIILVAMTLTINAVSKSLEAMTGVMNQIKQGNWNADYKHTPRFQEIDLFMNSFNAMMKEIRRLELDVYNEKLQKESTLQQYYQLQINPHFFINSLNMIYQFAQAKEYKLIQKLELHMSAYFRHSLKNRAQYVRVKDELYFVNEYIEIQKMRYPYHLDVATDVSDQVAEYLIPPLAIQTFIENAIKYSISTDELTLITLGIQLENAGGEDFLIITVTDNGEGFKPDVLSKLNENIQISHNDRECLGIFNIQQRLKYLYQGNAQIAIQNIIPHGASVRMRIPAMFFEENTDD